MTNYENQIDFNSGLAINCLNCIHCSHSRLGGNFALCKKAGNARCEYVHMCPITYGHICKNYSAWAPREQTIGELISAKIRKFLSR